MPAARTNRYAGGMPIPQSNEEFLLNPHAVFEDLESDPTQVKCLACSAASDTKDTIILRSGRAGHLTRDKHRDAVAAQQITVGAAVRPETLSRDPVPAQQARFNLSSMLLDSGSEDDTREPQQFHSQLDDIMMDGNQFFDADRNELFFSAGTEDTGIARRQALLEGMKNLDYYDHTVFGKVDREDSTISEAVAAMVEMGKL
jgi:hypothetical protein